MTLNEDRFSRLEEKVDNLVSVTHANHIDVINRLDTQNLQLVNKVHELESKVQKHDNHFDFVNKVFFGSSGLITLWFLIKDHFPK